MMRKHPRIMTLIILASVFLWLAGCGSSSSTKGKDEDTAQVVSLTQPLTEDTSLFPNAQLLAVIEDLLLTNSDGDPIETVTDEAVILDTRSTDAYAAGHIPGAINVQWDDFALWNEPPQKGTLKAVADLETQLGALGLTRDAWIVIYDDTVNSWGSAGRIFWMLEYLGCSHVQILNGGWDRWAEQDLPSETTAASLPAAVFEAATDTTVDVDKAYINSRLGDDDFIVVDTRTDEEFNGWILYDEARGGHIPDAVQLPYADYYNTDNSILGYAALKALFDANGITADKEIVAYCTAGVRSGFFYFLGRLMGFEQVANYDASIWDWAAADSASYSMEKLPRYAELVYPAWVNALIDYHADGSTTDAPPEYSYGREHPYLIFETQWGSFEDMANGWADCSYLDGHIPGALHSNSDTYENGYPRWFMLPDDELAAAVGSMGITADTTVIVYSNSPIFATRLWWILTYAGVTDVRLLNGGLAAWQAAGYGVETTVNEPVPVTFAAAVRPSVVATTDYVAARVDARDSLLADVRTYEEYTGKVSGYSYVVNKGRIPGAVYAFNADNPDLDYLDADGSFKAFPSIRNLWQQVGIELNTDSDDFDQEVIFYCGSGYRSSLSFLYAYLMGYENVRNYSDGWEGWSTTYIEDASYTADADVPGSTDGWIQDPSGRLVGDGVHPEWDFDNYPHVDRVVDARWVKEVLLENDNSGSPYVIADVSWGEAGDAFNAGHIPGAIHINTDEIEYDCFNPRNSWPVDAGEPACWDRSTTEEADAAKGLGPDDALPRNWWNIYPDEYLLPAIAYMGIDTDTTVVLYGESTDAVARVMWTLFYAGVEDVRIMEGGFDAWTTAGYAGSTETAERASVADFGATTALHPEYKVDIPYVRDVVDGLVENALLVDIRTYDEYIGASEPYSYIPTNGRIPGALWGTDDLINEDKTLMAPADIEALWAEQGITGDKHLSFYCGTAWRSSLAWLYGYMMGWENISNFDSSWFEWSMGEGSAYAGADPVLNPIVDDTPGEP
ncbi:hypothetical protein DSCO28_55630 [Desulfosarcina ovata subsp. sediminis]|uniref:Rhodanese domain-containing protein n=1 Tax=Desulfosarcina ovata subsp. sediminis TaxID=885957 RepID=A0A5K7ZXL0_9BACT|nr:rhodanese-like domain-containing protein [Desulfosarcina ovata]BBO84997.1 hypothetical protein DSCO28_55630 [Desulfosarcina ovata subsp. sediminis]